MINLTLNQKQLVSKLVIGTSKGEKMSILLRNDHPDINIDCTDLENMIEKVMSHLDCQNTEVSILLTRDADIRLLNKEFRSIDQPTDVLSFPQNQDEDLSIPGKKFLGDIAVSLDTAKIQANEHGLVLKEEIVLLLIHGILHLLGYDHEISEQEDKKMRITTRELFKLAFPEQTLADTCNY